MKATAEEKKDERVCRGYLLRLALPGNGAMSRARTVRVSVDPLNLSPASLFYARGLLLRNYPRFWKKLGSSQLGMCRGANPESLATHLLFWNIICIWYYHVLNMNSLTPRVIYEKDIKRLSATARFNDAAAAVAVAIAVAIAVAVVVAVVVAVAVVVDAVIISISQETSNEGKNCPSEGNQILYDVKVIGLPVR